MAGWINQNDTDIVLARSEAIRMVLAAYDAEGLSSEPPTYRLLHAGEPQAGPPQQNKADSIAARAETPAAPVQDVDALEDKQLTQIIDLERAEEPNDLLRKNAVQE
jgi:hypothetical protein